MGELLADLQRNWYIYVSMPVIAAVIGYVTKIVAIRMMFQPLEFVGWKPFLGWQGIIPRRAARMASIACDMMTENLLSPSDVMRSIEPERVAEELWKPISQASAEITRDVALAIEPELWESLPERVQEAVIRRIQRQVPGIVRAVTERMRTDIEEVFDLKSMVVGNLVRDKELLNRMFRDSGRKEFDFITHCGIYFGFLIGLLQMATFALLHAAWIMPVFGLATGWFTDWLALKMIFYPTEPRRYLGVLEWQGLFLKHREEVTQKYCALIAGEVITPHKVIESMLHGPLSDHVFVLVRREVERAIGRRAGPARRLLALAVGSRRYREVKTVVTDRIMRRMPETLRYLEGYAAEAMNLRAVLVARMRGLSAEEFEGLLRPAFQQDEWILITVGAALGFAVGELQVLMVEHLAT